MTDVSREPDKHRGRNDAVPLVGAECAYFFDIDGTLLEIAATPSVVFVDREMVDLIKQLFRACGGAVALISGRPIADIDALFSGLEIPVAGQHGVERRDAAGRVTRHPFPVDRLDEARSQLRDAVSLHPGLLLEDKGLSLALHYRQAPNLAGYAQGLIRSVQQALGAEFCIQSGKQVIELKPAGKDKGIAVREFMDETPFAGRTPVFVGDDETDEFGFAMVNRMGGRSVKVGEGATSARWRLRDVQSVHAWLKGGNTCSVATTPAPAVQ